MKKLKKFLAGMLGAMMAISIVPGAALAAPTIDTTQTGSLTIHKYEYNGNNAGTGTGEATDENNVPADAVPLGGVTFKATKVAELSTYYGTDAKALPTVAEAKILAEGAAASDIYTGVTSSAEGDTKGTVTFSDLPLGLYLVQEISAPAQITGKVEDFLISIPMTTVDGDDWIYDVHVFPKNSSTYAGVTLQKKGKIGDGTETNLAGATFVLQKCTNPEAAAAQRKWETVKANNKGDALGVDGVLTTGADGKITITDLAPGTYRFVETGVPNDTGYIMNGADSYEFVINDDGKVEIDGTEVDTTNTPIAIVNEKPDLEKEVKDREDGTWGIDGDYSAGDTVPYRITVDVPESIARLADFTISDTMDKLTYVTGSLKIYSDADMQNEILTTGGTADYTVDTSGADWSIAFNSKNTTTGVITSLLENYAGKSIYIYFEATLDDDAVVTSVGNPNTVELEYSNQILPESNDDGNPNEPGEPESDIITDQAVVYTFKIAVEKVDAADNKALAGVTFDLYRKLDDAATGDGVLTNPVSGLTGKYEKVNTSDLETDANGQINVSGLANGTYYLVETKTNEGYNLLQAPVEIELAIEYATTTTTKITTEDGVTTTATTVVNQKFEDADGNNGTITNTVKNSKGFTLPVTGGMGTILFSVVGLALVAGAAVILIRSRKKA